MSVAIRLRRDGAKNNPYYRVVVADKHSPRDGKFIELVGTYNPRKAQDNSTVKLDRVNYWISQGAQPSDTVRSIIKRAQVNAETRSKAEAALAAQSAPLVPTISARQASPVSETTPAAETTGAAETTPASDSSDSTPAA